MESEKTIEPKSKLFISYASEDKEIAHLIAKKLINFGVDIKYDELELSIGDSLKSKIENAISSSDYLIVLLSPASVKSKWVLAELELALAKELTTRNITILPVLLKDCKIPPFLSAKTYLDIRKNFDDGIFQLVNQLKLAPSLDFSKLDWKDFESMIADLLREIGFFNVKQNVKIEDRQIDIQASFLSNDPFEAEIEETWLIEVKFYRRERIDIKVLHQIIGLLSMMPEKYRGLLVTNGQLTSAAKKFLSSTPNNRVDLRVIDGPELRSLLLRHTSIVQKYLVEGD